MSSNFDPYHSPSTSLGLGAAGQQPLSSYAASADIGTDEDSENENKNSQTYKERRWAWDQRQKTHIFPYHLLLPDEKPTRQPSRREGMPSRRATTPCRSWFLIVKPLTLVATR